MDITFGFDPRRHYEIRTLVKAAQAVGITIAAYPTPKYQTRIWVNHASWKQGVLQIRQVRQRFVTFQEALRSFDHAIQSIFEKAFFAQKLREELDFFHAFLRSDRVSWQEKLSDGESRLLILLAKLVGVRTANQYEIKSQLGDGEYLVKKGVLELLEDGNWGAACCTIVQRLQPLLDRETRRILGQIPHIQNRKQLLGLIWEHYVWYAQEFFKTFQSFPERAERELKTARSPEAIKQKSQQLSSELAGLLLKFPDPFADRHQRAVNALWYVETQLAAGRCGGRVKGAMSAAVTHARRELDWLLVRDRDELPENRQKDFVFKGAA
jgi:hypothetical protein